MRGYVIGAHKTRFGPTHKTLQQLVHRAILGALDDAGLEPDQLGAFIVANFLGGPNESQLHLNAVVAGLMPGLHLPSWRVEAACASGGVAVHQALVALGEYDPILVIGVERLSQVVGTELTHNIGMAGDATIDQVVGLTFAASYAMVAQRHMAEFGTTLRDLESVSLKAHDNARLNPNAHFHYKMVTQEDVDAGQTVATPLRLYDCCPVSDGAAAVIVSKKPHGKRSVPVLGSAVSSDAISLVQRPDHCSFPAAVDAARRAYSDADLAPGDIDFAEVHDCFTIAEIVAMEDLGLAEKGHAVELLRNGETRIGGRLPVNASGGLKGGGHPIAATGVGQIVEVVSQLRGEAEEHQVDAASVGLTHSVGGIGGTCAVHILGGVR